VYALGPVLLIVVEPNCGTPDMETGAPEVTRATVPTDAELIVVRPTTVTVTLPPAAAEVGVIVAVGAPSWTNVVCAVSVVPGAPRVNDSV